MIRAATKGNIFRRPLTAESVSQRSMFTVWLALTGALIVVATLISVDASTGLKLNQADAEPVDLTSPVAIATATGNANSVVYGALEWTLVETRMIPRGDDSFSKPVVILEMVARNLDGQHQARARRRDMVLILEDGSRAPMDRFEHTPSTYRIAVDPGEAVPVTLVFKPVVTRDPWLDDVTLEIGEENHRPASLPLNGSTSDDNFPIAATVAPWSDDDAGAQQIAVGAGQPDVAVSLKEAMVAINAGQYRARQDEKLVLVQVEIESAAATNVQPWEARSFWQLDLDHQGSLNAAVGPIDPHHVSFLPTFGDDIGSTHELLRLVFAVPADADLSQMLLSAGSQKVKIGSIHPTSVAN